LGPNCHINAIKPEDLGVHSSTIIEKWGFAMNFAFVKLIFVRKTLILNDIFID
jgi:hypothetical protein